MPDMIMLRDSGSMSAMKARMISVGGTMTIPANVIWITFEKPSIFPLLMVSHQKSIFWGTFCLGRKYRELVSNWMQLMLHFPIVLDVP